MLSALPTFGNPLAIALCVIACLWLHHCRWTSDRHSPEDAERLIEAAGRFFPLRPRLPQRQQRQGDEPSDI